MAIRGIYLHIPFCESRCRYCDFYSLGGDRASRGAMARFTDAVCKELELVARISGDLTAVETIYFGGGTPSFLAMEHQQRIFAEIHERVPPSRIIEWTIEANPSSIDPSCLRFWKENGVSRLSVGIQSLDDSALSLLGRVHDRVQALAAVSDAYSAGFSDISVDLLCGIPGQSTAALGETLQTALSLPITHLSCYLLTLKRDHPLYSQLPNEDEQMRQLLLVHDLLAANGFEHYEISNYCKPGFRSRHNMNYWTGGGYWGLGPSAHSFDASAQRRWKNVSSLTRYCHSLLEEDRLPVEWSEDLTLEQQALEQWMLTLRLRDGFPSEWLSEPWQKQKATRLLAEGLLEHGADSPAHLRLTPRGLCVSDQIVAELAPNLGLV